MGHCQDSEILFSEFLHCCELNSLPALAILYSYVADREIAGAFCDKGLELLIVEALGSLGRTGRVLDDEPEVTVKFAADDCDFELHEVQSEGARLISENVLYLSELLVERRGFNVGSALAEGAVH